MKETLICQPKCIIYSIFTTTHMGLCLYILLTSFHDSQKNTQNKLWESFTHIKQLQINTEPKFLSSQNRNFLR